jgi:hypothetical protein
MIHLRLNEWALFSGPSGEVRLQRRLKDLVKHGERRVQIFVAPQICDNALEQIAATALQEPIEITLVLQRLPDDSILHAWKDRKFKLILPAPLLEKATSSTLTLLSRNLQLCLWVPIPSPTAELTGMRRLMHDLKPLAGVELGIGWESLGSGPRPRSTQNYREFVPLILDWIDDATTLSIRTYFSCGLPLSMFGLEQLGHLASRLVNWPIARCGEDPVMDENGGLHYCLLIGYQEPVMIDDETALDGLNRLTEKRLGAIRSLALADCRECRSLKTGACGGGCLAMELPFWQGTSATQNLILSPTLNAVASE